MIDGIGVFSVIVDIVVVQVGDDVIVEVMDKVGNIGIDIVMVGDLIFINDLLVFENDSVNVVY